MKKLLIFAIAIVIVIALISCSFSGAEFNSATTGQTKFITWTEVNARTEHSISSEVISVLHQGDTVTLTGNELHYLGGDDLATNDWIEIYLGDTTAWVVQKSIQWH